MSGRRALYWFIYPLCLLIIGACLFLGFWAARDQCVSHYLERAQVEAQAISAIMARTWEPVSGPEDRIDLNKLISEMGRIKSIRITVVGLDGEIIADSQAGERPEPNLLEQPEIKSALQGETTASIRSRSSGDGTAIYAASPVYVDNSIVAATRSAFGESALDRSLLGFKRRLILVGLVLALVSAGVCLLVGGWITEPLEEMTAAARQFAAGDLLYRVDGGTVAETVTLATTMNRMAENLHEKISDITHQRNELEAVLSGMVEAVLVMDGRQFIKKMNRAAGGLFNVNPQQCEGKTIIEAIRNSDLQGFVQRTLDSGEPVEEELRLIGEKDLSIQAHGAPLKSRDGNFEGIVVVLNDVTNIKKLETIRQDFVANVSHELKTPVTSIKGFLETLKDGALDDPEDARRFLDIMVKQTDRLNMIIEDLMSLSRIEQDEKKGAIGFEPERVKEVLDSVVMNCKERASEKEMEIIVSANDVDLKALINRTLLEQALANLIDNAIKYSDQGKKIWIHLSQTPTEAQISVRDQGCGISKEHAARIFERFYRVDKARSRRVGGTGLGLAIVKHIARAHKGRMEVQSALGEGSTFSLFLPKAT